MPDIIQLLPDSIANQIAAGEVVQRPASVVKELLENSIDAGSTHIQLIIKDSGKTSIQVVDNGKGMSETDARMAFERHATSKISNANDLFHIRTMGFRGEAMASIAAIAQVELITRQEHESVGHRIVIEGSNITKSEKVQANPGTSVTVKNLFYNVPARRKFLKSDPVELKHILDEFHRVSLAYPEVHFVMYHNGNELYHLPKANQKQRIIGILGKNFNEKLVPVNEETEVASFAGFIGKPDAARKTPGDQYIFVNRRFIKSNYLNHAIRSAYEDLITKEMYPTYILFLEIDPANIDINVHPTKTEIKFEDERLIYNYLRVSVKHSLGQYSVAPMLDFDVDSNFTSKYSSPNTGNQPGNPVGYNPSQFPNFFRQKEDKATLKNWTEIYKGLQQISVPDEHHGSKDGQLLEREAFGHSDAESKFAQAVNIEPYQLHNQYIVYQVKSGMMLIDQQAAHERILYERYLAALKNEISATQKELFPRTIELDVAKSEVMKSILPKINRLGFEIEDFGHHSYIIHGTPAGLDEKTDISQLITSVIQQYVDNLEFQLGIDENLARSMAYSASIKKGTKVQKEEMVVLIDHLFACQLPFKSPSGKNCFIIIELDELTKRFTS
ncbi:MAG: DNA mismatch repair endonuclease MutL [Saprospiraceae bacterium]|nr:MAG: DNA mismatch repair protein mutL [Bacteroidetes bacterium OLB9]MCO6464916.1 DNA mismatch repair endonuclease MutL [Saprospiraceae bacterium]